MNIVSIIAPQQYRRWQAEVITRLGAAGHAVAVRHGTHPRTAAFDAIVGIEGGRFGIMLASLVPAIPERLGVAPDLVVDFTGAEPRGAIPSLTIGFDGHGSVAAAAAAWGSPPEPVLTVMLDGRPVAIGRPMVEDQLWLSKALDDVLARAVTLMVASVERFAAHRLSPLAEAVPPATPSGRLLAHYLPRLTAGLLRRRWHKLRYRPFYWQTAYRLIDGPGVAETGGLDGVPWTVLPDDGERFYADPFVFAHDGRSFVFVEDFPYATEKGVLAVAELGPDGMLGVPKLVLEEPHHLSYPQVFARDGEIWMLPESCAADQLVLYRAAPFPDHWVREAVLLDGIEIADATLVEHGDRLWLIGSVRDGLGSSSDTMAVYSAERLTGPWTAHRDNPIRIDRAAARPGGAFIRASGKLLLPLQDCIRRYGDSLGLAEVQELSEAAVRLGTPQAITAAASWPDGLHTINRLGRLEVIDGNRLSRLR